MARFLLQSTLFSAALAATCYNSNGSVASTNTPCTSGNNTFCCSDDYTCLSNGLCLWDDGTFWLGTCTDQTWTSSACPKFCSKVRGNPELSQCSISDGTYCCGLNSSCCDDTNNLLTLGKASTLGFILSHSLTPLTISATPSPRSNSSSTTIATTTNSTTTNSTTTTPATTITSPPKPTASSPSSGSSSSSSGGAITGGTVGGTVGGIAVVGGFILAAWALL
ncbi:hypothetical protein V8E54_008147 [Elaphomyces granulatus]